MNEGNYKTITEDKLLKSLLRKFSNNFCTCYLWTFLNSWVNSDLFENNLLDEMKTP